MRYVAGCVWGKGAMQSDPTITFGWPVVMRTTVSSWPGGQLLGPRREADGHGWPLRDPSFSCPVIHSSQV